MKYATWIDFLFLKRRKLEGTRKLQVQPADRSCPRPCCCPINIYGPLFGRRQCFCNGPRRRLTFYKNTTVSSRRLLRKPCPGTFSLATGKYGVKLPVGSMFQNKNTSANFIQGNRSSFKTKRQHTSKKQVQQGNVFKETIENFGSRVTRPV